MIAGAGGALPDSPLHSRLRFLSAVVLLAAAWLFLLSRSHAESVPLRKKLDSFPLQLSGWQGRDFQISPEVLEVLGNGEFLSRSYQRAAGEPGIDLFVAYFPSQRTGDTIHSPKNCLPGAGWAPVEAGVLQVSGPDGASFPANRYVIARGDDRQAVLYWYLSHGRGVASEYWAKFYLVADAIRLNRTDGSLVRVVTPLAQRESVDSGIDRALAFTKEILPLLHDYIPR